MKDLLLATVRGLLSLLSALYPPAAHRLAFRLFCRPAGRSRTRPVEEDMMKAAMRSHMDLDGQRVAIYRWGDGNRPVLLAHGWESRGARYAQLAERLLALGYSPVTFDAPAHGDSDGSTATILDYQRIMQTLNGEYGTFEAVVAHSFGVPCAFHAVKHGVAARRIVAIAGVSDFEYLVDEFSRTLALTPPVVDQLRRNVEMLFAPLSDVWSRFSVTHGTDALSQPVLFVHDRNDNVVRFAQGLKSARHFASRARLMATSGLGHHRILSDDSVLTAICDFIAQPTSHAGVAVHENPGPRMDAQLQGA